MPAYIETWDVNAPNGNEDVSRGDDRLRELKRSLTERLGEDHEFQTDETGNNKIGYHKKVTLTARSADPALVAGCGILFTKDVGSGVIELFYEDAAGNVIQLTAGGSVKSLSKEVKMWFGSIASLPAGWYLCNGSGGRPDLRDQFIVCAIQDSSNVPMSNVTGSLSQSASPTHNHGGLVGSTTLTLAQIPAHTHTMTFNKTGGGSGGTPESLAQNATPSTLNTGSSGGGTGHDHTITASTAIPPFFALAMISQYNQ